MRKFKFRIWDLENKIFQNPEILKVDNNGIIYYQRDGKYVIMQSSYLLDSHGREIYQDDLLDTILIKNSFIDGTPITKEGKEGRYVVRDLSNFYCTLFQLFDSANKNSIIEVAKQFKIVGNLHDGIKK